MKVPLLDLNAQYNGILPDIKQEIDKVISSHAYKMGPQVREFEENIEQFCQVNHAVGCASGTDALILALLGLIIPL